MKQWIGILCLAFTVTLVGRAQDSTAVVSQTANDTVSYYIHALDSLKQQIYSRNKNTITLTPYLFQVMGPSTYYSDIAKEALSMDETTDSLQAEAYRNMLRFYLLHPEMIRYYDAQFEGEDIITSTVEQPANNDIKEVIQDIAQDEDLSHLDTGIDMGLKIEKPNFWKFSGTTQLKFTQNFISDNWYKGGNNNGTMLAEIQLYAKYNDTKRISWENKLDMRLGFITTSADTCHTINTNTDRLNFYSKINVKKTDVWSYTCTFDATTQFLPGYKTNKHDPFSNFLAPLDATTSLGVDLKPKAKKGSISIVLLPLSYKFRLIETDEQNIHNTYGQQSNFKQDWGSKIEFNTNFTLVKNLTWKCRFYCFTSYKYVESEMENTFDYKFSKYISATFNTLFRFDDNRPQRTKDSKLGYFQLKEYLTFGLSYSF